MRNRFIVTCAAVAAVCSGVAGVARAQDYIGDLNRSYTQVPAAQRSDEVLLPALIGLEEPPESVDSLREAQLLIAGMAGWDDAAAWASAEPQQEAVAALRRAVRSSGGETGVRGGMSFVQPYGVSGVSPDLVRAGLYTELGDPPLLAAADHQYLDHLDTLQILVNVEASRLLAEGDAVGAGNLLVDLAYLGRQLGDRALSREADYGLRMAIGAIRRFRDVLYLDAQDGLSLEPRDLLDLIAALDPQVGALDLPRLRFPRGEKSAALQLVETVYQPRGGIDERVFASTMSRLGSVNRPLRLFSEAAKWERLGGLQADWFDARDEAERIYGDWESRWSLNAFDPLMVRPFAYDMSDPTRFAAVRASLRDLSEIFTLRRVLRLEAAGAQAALGVLGYRSYFGVYPPRLSSVRPQWLKNLEEDPFNPAPEMRRNAGRPKLQFFVPVRDAYQRDRRATPSRHLIEFFPERGENFAREFGDEAFVLYSVGGNGRREFAEQVSEDPEAEVGDYILWPPLLSIEREHLIQTDQIATGS